MSVGTATLTRLGRYRLLHRLGGGTASVVYAAHDEAMDRPVAIKMIVADLQDERETRARFYREARVTSQLLHHNIVTVLDVGEDGGRPFLVMERLEGHPLDHHLKVGNAPGIDQKLALIRQILDGLQAAHDAGVVHRDIKPSNLFVQSDGTVKILDFGLARLQASTLTANGQIVGTPDFMSPEQAAGEKVDHRSDIFALASVAYLILTGRSPFARESLRHTLESLLQSAPEPISESLAPAAVRHIIAKAHSTSPSDRYQTCTEMLAALREAGL